MAITTTTSNMPDNKQNPTKAGKIVKTKKKLIINVEKKKNYKILRKKVAAPLMKKNKNKFSIKLNKHQILIHLLNY